VLVRRRRDGGVVTLRWRRRELTESTGRTVRLEGRRRGEIVGCLRRELLRVASRSDVLLHPAIRTVVHRHLSVLLLHHRRLEVLLLRVEVLLLLLVLLRKLLRRRGGGDLVLNRRRGGNARRTGDARNAMGEDALLAVLALAEGEEPAGDGTGDLGRREVSGGGGGFRGRRRGGAVHCGSRQSQSALLVGGISKIEVRPPVPLATTAGTLRSPSVPS
jgi:hypothetical protein